MEYINNPVAFLILVAFNLSQLVINILLFIQKEQYKSNLEKKIYVHKLQFESEFTLYKDLWSRLIDSIVSLRDLIDEYKIQPEDENIDFKIKYNLIAAKANSINSIFTENKPFYHKTIYSKMIDINNEMLELMHTMKGRVASGEITKSDKEHDIANIKKIIEMSEIVCSKIRERIGTN